jgi:hypothetical protein
MHFSIQHDERADVSNGTALLVYVRYAWHDDLLCLNRPSNTAGLAVFTSWRDCIPGLLEISKKAIKLTNSVKKSQ